MPGRAHGSGLGYGVLCRISTNSRVPTESAVGPDLTEKLLNRRLLGFVQCSEDTRSQRSRDFISIFIVYSGPCH